MGAYIINIPDTVDRIIYVNVGPDSGRTYISSHRVEDLTPYTEPDLEQVREEAYQQGLSDAKEGKATCQYCEYAYLDETEEPCKKCCKAYMNKYKPKAKEEQIQVGDEVISPNGKGVVTEITDIYVRIMYAKGSGQVVKPEDLTKTGRHFPEIAEILQKMKESDNG